MNDIPNCSGIYKITCTANGRFYIGSAVNLYIRKYNHWSTLRRDIHRNQYLQRAWNKYGPDAFTFEVLEYVLPMSLTAREQYWLNKLKPFGKKGFNIDREAGSPLGRKHTPEAIENMRRVQSSPEARERKRQANLARSFETQEKMRRSMIG